MLKNNFFAEVQVNISVIILLKFKRHLLSFMRNVLRYSKLIASTRQYHRESFCICQSQFMS